MSTDWSKVARGVMRKVERDNPDPKVRDLAKAVGESMDASKKIHITPVVTSTTPGRRDVVLTAWSGEAGDACQERALVRGLSPEAARDLAVYLSQSEDMLAKLWRGLA